VIAFKTPKEPHAPLKVDRPSYSIVRHLTPDLKHYTIFTSYGTLFQDFSTIDIKIPINSSEDVLLFISRAKKVNKIGGNFQTNWRNRFSEYRQE
jgi:hypothetical protein